MPWGDVKAISQAGAELLEDEPCRQEIGETACRRVMDNYMFEHFRQHWLNLLTDCLGESTLEA